jgi:hypothetical protein
VSLVYQQTISSTKELHARWSEAAKRVADVAAVVLVWHERDGKVPDIAMRELQAAVEECRAKREALRQFAADSGAHP